MSRDNSFFSIVVILLQSKKPAPTRNKSNRFKLIRIFSRQLAIAHVDSGGAAGIFARL